MGTLAAKHTDMVVGLDMHMVQPPPPAPPVMIPHPVVGMILDPADYDQDACSVFINGLPRARAGSVCMLSPPHVPVGGVFVMPPKSEAEILQGSASVTADGEALSASTHQVLGCHDVGAPAPTRAWKRAAATSLMKAGSAVLSLASGGPVLVGGAPTTSATAAPAATASEGVLSLTLVDTFGTPLAGVRMHIVDGDTTITVETDAAGRVPAERVRASRLRIDFVDLAADATAALRDAAPEPSLVPEGALHIAAERASAFCDQGDVTFVVAVPSFAFVMHTLDLGENVKRASIELFTDDDDGADYRHRCALDDRARVAELDAEHLFVLFRGLPRGRPFTLRIVPSGDGGSAYPMFTKTLLPLERGAKPSFVPS